MTEKPEMPDVVWVWFASGGSICFTDDQATAKAFGAVAYYPAQRRPGDGDPV